MTRQGITFLITALLLQFNSAVTIIGQSAGNTGSSGNRSIPVYPGALLVTSRIVGEEATCCDFNTNENLDKVIGFYETALKTRALDAAGLAVKYPDMKAQIDMMISQMPPQMKIRFFVLQEYMFQGKKGAELFEVVSDISGVHFNISETKLLAKDTHYEAEWKEAMGQTEEGADRKPLDPLALGNSLPATLPAGFEKGDVNYEKGEQPMVSVSYSKLVKKANGSEGSDNKYVDINISITDGLTSMEFVTDMIKAEREGEKAVMVKGRYQGKEVIEKNDSGCVGAQKVFMVNNRFLVEIRTNGICDMALLNQVADSMSFEKLPE
jgi:hypothetical protein